MKSTLIDSNVLVDLFGDESEWKGWSDQMIFQCRNQGPIVINRFNLIGKQVILANAADYSVQHPLPTVPSHSLE